MMLLHTQTTKIGQKTASNFALVQMYTTRLENLPNHTRDRQKFVRQRQFWTSTSGPSWQHQCREGLGAENCGRFIHHSDSSSRTAESVQKKTRHFLEPLAFVKTFFWPLTVSHNSCSPITTFLILWNQWSKVKVSHLMKTNPHLSPNPASIGGNFFGQTIYVLGSLAFVMTFLSVRIEILLFSDE